MVERFASDEDFGRTAWFSTSLAAARAKRDLVLAKRNKSATMQK